jgi:hypothetical protein
VDLREKLNGLYATPNVISVIKSRRMKWVGHVERIVYAGFYGEISGKETTWKPRPRREGNIKMNF